MKITSGSRSADAFLSSDVFIAYSEKYSLDKLKQSLESIQKCGSESANPMIPILTIFLVPSKIVEKMVRIVSTGLALSDPHFCILSRDCFNMSREYFLLWAIKTSLDRNPSALLDPEVLFSRIARHLACLAFCKLQVGIFQRSVLFID